RARRVLSLRDGALSLPASGEALLAESRAGEQSLRAGAAEPLAAVQVALAVVRADVRPAHVVVRAVAQSALAAVPVVARAVHSVFRAAARLVRVRARVRAQSARALPLVAPLYRPA